MSEVHDPHSEREPATEPPGQVPGGEAAPYADAPSDSEEEPRTELEIVTAERDDYYDQLLRTRAEFDNLRKRMLRQQTEQLERATEALVLKLLDALDIFDGARAHAEGFEQVGSNLASILEKEGLERIEPTGAEFDPTEADAVAHEDGKDGPVVTAVLRPGYRWKGKVLRPAMVKVRG